MGDNAEYHYGVLVSRETTGRKPNLKKRAQRRWLKSNPPGSSARLAWENGKSLTAQFKQILGNEG